MNKSKKILKSIENINQISSPKKLKKDMTKAYLKKKRKSKSSKKLQKKGIKKKRKQKKKLRTLWIRRKKN